jgi:hypothetical protein
MKIKIAFVLLTLTLSPGMALAFCQGETHAQTSMSCGDGKVFDAEAKTCVPVSG